MNSDKIFEEFDWLNKLAPSFEIDGEKIDILDEPKEFYEKLIELIGRTERRIIFASLYLGIGELEEKLISAIQSKLGENQSNHHSSPISVKFLLDYSRGTRGVKNSCSMILPLMKEFGDERVEAALFHTPLLRGVLKAILPGRWNEVVGVQHMKLYIFDDTLVISGANLSKDYFTNRQDRYVVIRDCPELVEFYSEIVDAVSMSSFRLDADGELKLNERDCEHHPFKGNKQLYCTLLKRRIESVTDRWLQRRNRSADSRSKKSKDRSDTKIYALLQMGPIGVDTEDVVIRRLLTKPIEEEQDSTRSKSKTTDDDYRRMDLASGYFNLTREYSDLILGRSLLNYRILMASPKANGFFNGQGISGYIPSVYVHVSRIFFDAVNRLGQDRRIELLEYFKQGWTFHAKGMWFTLGKDEPLPSATLIGSTNYGYRSLHRDLESQLVIVTENARLRQQLKMERDRLYNHAIPIDSSTFKRPDHSVPYWVRLVARFWRNFF